MARSRVYVDTSVFGGVYDAAFELASRRFFDLVRSGAYVVLVSEYTSTELTDAPERVREVLAELPVGVVEWLSPSDDVEALAGVYIEHGVLPESSRGDALHVGFDCVEMKQKAQEKLLKEYEERGSGFPSFSAFIQAKVSKDPWASEMRRRFTAVRPSTRSVGT